MDNFHINVVAKGRELLGKTLEIAFSEWPRGAAGYRIDKAAGLIFLWHVDPRPQDEGAVPFPFMMDPSGAADFAARWLATADYGQEPDHDGDNTKGWRVFLGGFGRVHTSTGEEDHAVCAVQPAWAMHGK